MNNATIRKMLRRSKRITTGFSVKFWQGRTVFHTIRAMKTNWIQGETLSACYRMIMVVPMLCMADPLLSQEASSIKRPNIVIIVTDDLGWADLGCYGLTDMKTPEIDALAKEGVRFTEAYVPHPTCGPSRAGLLTGRHPYRFGFRANPTIADGQIPLQDGDTVDLPTTEITFGRLFKDNGYATGFFGKDHCGETDKSHPLKKGFDHFFGFRGSGMPSLVSDERPFLNLEKDGEKVKEKEYLADAITREAIGFINENKASPFLLYVPYNAPHTPLEAPPCYLEQVTGKDVSENRRKYLGMVAAVDRGVGNICRVLREQKLFDNTLIFFLSDNGGAEKYNAASNKPLRGYKAGVYEGGVRVPFIFAWPRAGIQGTYSRPISTLDIFATITSAAGIVLPKDRIYDGVDLIPYLKKTREGDPHEFMFWRRGNMIAVRHQDYKLIYNKKSGKDSELYDIKNDISETKPLDNKEMTALLFDKIREWNNQMPPPIFVHVSMLKSYKGDRVALIEDLKIP